MNKILVAIFALVLAACQPASETEPAEAPESAPETEAAEMAEAAPEATAAVDEASTILAAILDAQPEEIKARYQYRHPQETLEFFGVKPGMTVVEALPGGGWYTKILLPYLGSEGRLIGANYSLEVTALYPSASEESMERARAWISKFPVDAAEWAGDDGASIDAFYFGSMPDAFKETADFVFIARALHGMARFDSQGDFVTEAMADAYAVLKPGGVLGVVQHHASDDMSDEFADGDRGYLKKAYVIAAAEQAGFELVDESDINANPKDQPGEDDFVWRLPPSLSTSKEDPELRAKYEAIGESNRMTLKFRKPE
jgi:predicted methyltransferase